MNQKHILFPYLGIFSAPFSVPKFSLSTYFPPLTYLPYRNSSLELTTKARACKVVSQKRSLKVHAACCWEFKRV